MPGTKTYGTSLDLWSLGCIFVELWTGKPLFRGNDDVQQLVAIFSCLGAPNESIWPNMMKLSNAKTIHFTPTQPSPGHELKFVLRKACVSSAQGSQGLQLVKSLLTYDPNQRPTAEAMLLHSYFEESPRPLAEYMMPTFSSTHKVKSDNVRKPKNRK